MLTDYAGNKSHLSLSQQPLVGHKVRPAIAKDSLKRPGTKGIKSLSQIPGQSPSVTSIEQDWKHQGPEDSDFCPPAQVPAGSSATPQYPVNPWLPRPDPDVCWSLTCSQQRHEYHCQGNWISTWPQPPHHIQMILLMIEQIQVNGRIKFERVNTWTE